MSIYCRCPHTNKLLIWDSNIDDAKRAINATRQALDEHVQEKYGMWAAGNVSVLAVVK